MQGNLWWLGFYRGDKRTSFYIRSKDTITVEIQDNDLQAKLIEHGCDSDAEHGEQRKQEVIITVTPEAARLLDIEDLITKQGISRDNWEEKLDQLDMVIGNGKYIPYVQVKQLIRGLLYSEDLI